MTAPAKEPVCVMWESLICLLVF